MDAGQLGPPAKSGPRFRVDMDLGRLGFRHDRLNPDPAWSRESDGEDFSAPSLAYSL